MDVGYKKNISKHFIKIVVEILESNPAYNMNQLVLCHV